MEFHPAANLFPLLSEAELFELADDIKAHGLHHPIVTLDGKILDGRNRWLACQMAGVEPRFEEWAGEGSPTAWVLSENLKRRHLTPSERAVIGAKALPLFEAEARERQQKAAEETNARLGRGNGAEERLSPIGDKRLEGGRSSEKAAAVAGVSARQIQRAKALEMNAPDLLDKVVAGDLTVTAATRQAEDRGVLKKVPQRAAKSRVRVEPVRVIRPPKPLPELDTLSPSSRQLIREFEENLAIDLFGRYPVLLLNEWEEVSVILRRRLIRLLEGKALAPHRKTVPGAAESGNGRR